MPPAGASAGPVAAGPAALAAAAAEAPPQAEVAAKADSAPQCKRRCSAIAEGAVTPAKKPRTSAGGSGAKRAGQRKRAPPEEPVRPAPPPDAFALFSKSKWDVLVGEPKDCLEQAKLMWRASAQNDRTAFQMQAAQLRSEYDEACQAYAREYEAYRKALPPAARAELRQQEKEAMQAEKVRAKERQERDKVFRVELKNMGDRVKDNLQICRLGPKRGGVWVVPDGQIRFKNVCYELFRFIFGVEMHKCTPQGATESTPVISLQLTQAEAGRVFGVTKLRGGSMYAKFRVCAMSVTYRPQERSLDLGYKMEEYYF